MTRSPPNGARRLREAALGPRIHAELWERYGIDLPSDQSLKRFLVLERSFNESSVDELLAEYKQTMAFAGLAARGGGVPASGATGNRNHPSRPSASGSARACGAPAAAPAAPPAPHAAERSRNGHRRPTP